MKRFGITIVSLVLISLFLAVGQVQAMDNSESFEITGFRMGYAHSDYPDSGNLYLNMFMETSWQVEQVYTSFGPDWKDGERWRYQVDVYGTVVDQGTSLTRAYSNKSIHVGGWDVDGGLYTNHEETWWNGSLNPNPNEVSAWLRIDGGILETVDFNIQDYYSEWDGKTRFSAQWTFAGYGGGNLGIFPEKGMALGSFQMTPIPEPASIALFALGGTLCAYRRRLPTLKLRQAGR